MKVQTLKKVLKSSYNTGKISDADLVVNPKLTGKRVQVYYNPKTKKAIVSHRGSASLKDWAVTNVGMAVGYEGGKRFKHAQKIQKEAEKLYGAKNVTTVGHSLGGRIAEKVGKKSNKIITYNKATTIRSLLTPTQSNQTDIRTSGDIVSQLSKYQKKRGTSITIPSTNNPIKAHNINQLNSVIQKTI
jgi:hypothetical protein